MEPINLEELTIVEVAKRFRRHEMSPVELTKAFLDRVGRLNPTVNAYVTITADEALIAARFAEQEMLRGSHRGPLHGIPVAVKDNLATIGVRTTAGSKILSDWVPSFDATVVERLKRAGAILLGKANMHEWASGGSTINPYFGTTRNPWDLRIIPGGSSGGSAAALAASMCLGSLGTDNRGSVRSPAAMCGVVGLKPTYGRVSRFGVVEGTGGYSTDHVGIFSKTVRDCAVILQAIAGHDPKDSLSSEEPVPEYSRSIGPNVKGLRFGVIENHFNRLVVDEIQTTFSGAVDVLRSLGMEQREVSIPHIGLAVVVQACCRAENISAHEGYLRSRPRDYSPALLYRNIATLMISGAIYVTAQRVRRLIFQEFEKAFDTVDVIVAPTVGVPTPTIEECKQGFMEVAGRKVNLPESGGAFGTSCTIPFNVTGIPAISVPCGFSARGLPVGMQIAGKTFGERMVFRVAHAYERQAKWYKQKPRLTPEL